MTSVGTATSVVGLATSVVALSSVVGLATSVVALSLGLVGYGLL